MTYTRESVIAHIVNDERELLHWWLPQLWSYLLWPLE